MFSGQDLHTFDDKGRLTLPARYREVLDAGVVITKSVVEPCLWVFTQQTWQGIAERIGSLDSLDDNVRLVGRHIFAHAIEVVPDRQGRVVIPDRLRKFAGLNGEALIVGSIKRLEIWNADRWAEVDGALETNPDLLKESVKKLGISIGI